MSRVDQDFDIRRVLPLADKYLPTYKRKTNYKLVLKVGKLIFGEKLLKLMRQI